MQTQPLLIEQIAYHSLPVIGWRQWTRCTETVFERRSRMVGVEECEKCGGRVEFWEDTEEWTEVDGVAPPQWWDRPRWQHNSYGLSYGFCETCPTAYHDGFDGMYMIDLTANERTEK